jgi:hypothetical protein
MRRYIFVLFCFITYSCGSSRNAVPPGAIAGDRLLPFGRTAISNGRLELISSASYFGFSFEGKECSITVSLPDWLDHNYLQYEIDGIYQRRIRIGRGKEQSIKLNADVDGKHTARIYKATEAHTGPVFIHSIEGRSVLALQPASAPLIEFIGNSITCGAAADPSEVPCGQGEYHDQHNAYYAYGPRVARALKVNFMLSGVSGIGIYRNWNSDGPTMPQVYDKTDFHRQREWNFATYTPKIVSIALGTNDFSNGDGSKPRLPFDSAAFVSNYIRFVQLVKSKYPAAYIALLSSPMIHGERRTLLQNCLTAVKANIDKTFPSHPAVATYFFEPMQARGCTGHPGVEDHEKLAKELVPFFDGLLKKQ